MFIECPLWTERGFPGGLVVKNPPANAGDSGSIPGLGRSPGKEMRLAAFFKKKNQVF